MQNCILYLFFFLKYIKEKIDLWESKFLFTNLKEVNTTNASAKFWYNLMAIETLVSE